MKKLLVIALSCFLSSNGVYAADSSCKVQAAEKKLSGAAKNSFVKKCEKDTAAKGGRCGTSAARSNEERSTPIAYVIGERGPEFFIPRQSGCVISNEEVANLGGTVAINRQNHVDARSDMQSVLRAMALAKASTLAAIQDSKRRGGTFR